MQHGEFSICLLLLTVNMAKINHTSNRSRHFWLLRETIGQPQGRTGKQICPAGGKCFAFISRMLKETSRLDHRQMIYEFEVWEAICSPVLAQLAEEAVL